MSDVEIKDMEQYNDHISRYKVVDGVLNCDYVEYLCDECKAISGMSRLEPKNTTIKHLKDCPHNRVGMEEYVKGGYKVVDTKVVLAKLLFRVDELHDKIDHLVHTLFAPSGLGALAAQKHFDTVNDV